MQLKTIFNRVTEYKPFVVERVELIDDESQPTTGDTSLLHSYVASLGHSELFADAQLISIERLSDNGKQTTEPGQSRFSVKLVMRGGYGQPTGPQASGDQVATESNEGQGGAES